MATGSGRRAGRRPRPARPARTLSASAASPARSSPATARPRRPGAAPATGRRRAARPARRRSARGRRRPARSGRPRPPGGRRPSPGASSGAAAAVPSSCEADHVAVVAAATPACGRGASPCRWRASSWGRRCPRPACRPRRGRGRRRWCRAGCRRRRRRSAPRRRQLGDAVLVEVARGEDRHVGAARRRRAPPGPCATGRAGRPSRAGRRRSSMPSPASSRATSTAVGAPRRCRRCRCSSTTPCGERAGVGPEGVALVVEGHDERVRHRARQRDAPAPAGRHQRRAAAPPTIQAARAAARAASTPWSRRAEKSTKRRSPWRSPRGPPSRRASCALPTALSRKVSTSWASTSGAGHPHQRLAGEGDLALGHRPHLAGEAEVGAACRGTASVEQPERRPGSRRRRRPKRRPRARPSARRRCRPRPGTGARAAALRTDSSNVASLLDALRPGRPRPS